MALRCLGNPGRFTIPLAIASNIVTPRVQRALDNRLSKGRDLKAAKQSKRRQEQLDSLSKQYDEVSALHADSAKLTHHYLDALLWIAFFGAFGSIYGAMFAVFGELGHWNGFMGIVARVGAQATALLTAALIFTKSLKALGVARRTRDFEAYDQRTQKQLAELADGGT